MQEQAHLWTIQNWIYRTDLCAGEIKSFQPIWEYGSSDAAEIVRLTGMTNRHIRLCLLKLMRRGAITEFSCECGCRKKKYVVNQSFFLAVEEAEESAKAS